MSEWENVRKGMPCPICFKEDWCSISHDRKGIICKRENNGKAIVKKSKNGEEFFLYRTSFDDPIRFLKNPHLKTLTINNETKISNDLDLIDKIYNYFLQQLTLFSKHEEDLIKRGFSTEEISLRGYKSIPETNRHVIANLLRKKFSTDQILSIPGFYQKDNYLTFAGKSGLAIPCRDVFGKIFAIKIRIDNEQEGGKYRYFSSKFHAGPSAISSIHCPIRIKEHITSIIVTEGELKADLCSFRMSSYAVAISGVSNLRGLIEALNIYKPTNIYIAFDNDMFTNPIVKKAFINIYTILTQHNFKVGILQWK